MTYDNRDLQTHRQAITAAYRLEEKKAMAVLLKAMPLAPYDQIQVQTDTMDLIKKIRKARQNQAGIDAFMQQYHLSSEEGIALMCLAESLLRIPDKHTQDKLIQDKLGALAWEHTDAKSHSLFVNAATWGLMLTGKIYTWNELNNEKLKDVLKRFAAKKGDFFIRQAVSYAMKILGKQFVMGRTMKEALHRAKSYEKDGYTFSYDMLGEAAKTAADAKRYYAAYKQAIIAIGEASKSKNYIDSPGISVKLSALHPRYEFSQTETVCKSLIPQLRELVLLAKQYDIGFTVDAEECDKLDLSLDIITAIFCDPALKDWNGFGLALQAYQKRAFYVIDYLAAVAKQENKTWMLRLVKGAYWDTEIKLAQELGLSDYPVFTQKINTDASYLACAAKILQHADCFYPQFATHNAHTVSSILNMLDKKTAVNFEFQCLHGMGYHLYDALFSTQKKTLSCRVYAPVGTHEDLLAYLVRRLLENGANSSFVNRLADQNASLESLAVDPILSLREEGVQRHPHIPLPMHILPQRKNSMGLDLSDRSVLHELEEALLALKDKTYEVHSLIGIVAEEKSAHALFSPAEKKDKLGSATFLALSAVPAVFDIAEHAFATWNKLSVQMRADCLFKAADLLQTRMTAWISLLNREAGKTLPDAIAEIREAIDFCRYYAAEALRLQTIQHLPGPTGEQNTLQLSGRGVFLCISPWNFPLAIFMGQITAALVVGNTVVAKPAEQTNIIAYEAVKLLYEAGIPRGVLQLVLGEGETLGQACVEEPRLSGVLFTGSTVVAKAINKTLADKSGPITPLIAETGGQNVMFVDASALPEQVVRDVILSAFGSAGQRCSALRVLFLQEEVADKILTMLQGAMETLSMGDPSAVSTDIGPVIDAEAKAQLMTHLLAMEAGASVLYRCLLPAKMPSTYYFAPCLVEIPQLSFLKKEHFGPFLHVIRYQSSQLDDILRELNALQYGLTLGIHSRINTIINHIITHTHVGNYYVNRSMTGAVVGVHPFGGEKLSGTGPKAGGPHYLLRLCTEHTVSVNTTAAGGNASLMSLG